MARVKLKGKDWRLALEDDFLYTLSNQYYAQIAVYQNKELIEQNEKLIEQNAKIIEQLDKLIKK